MFEGELDSEKNKINSKEQKFYIESLVQFFIKSVIFCENFASIYKNVLYTFISNSFLI